MNINLRTKKSACSGQSRYDSYGDYATVIMANFQFDAKIDHLATKQSNLAANERLNHKFNCTKPCPNFQIFTLSLLNQYARQCQYTSHSDRLYEL